MKRLLIIEEDPDVREMMVFLFENNGYDVITHGKDLSVADALSIAPNLIVVDYQLGDMPGNDLVKKLKSDDKCNPIPIILYSATQSVDKIRVKSLAEGFIGKPYELDDFVWQVSRMAL